MPKTMIWVISASWAVLIWSLTTTPQIVVTDNTLLQQTLMMLAHFTFFGIQAVFFSVSLENQPSSIFCQPLILTSLYGALIELRQLTVPGRSADPLDWLLDTLGAFTFLLFLKKLQYKS